MAQYLMGIDNGSTAIKAGIYDLEGHEMAVAGSVCDVIVPAPGFYERDMAGIWQANATAIRSAIEKAGIRAADIAAVSMTGHGNGLHLIDADGQPVHNAIEGMDGRAAAYVEKWMKDGTFERVHPKAMQSLWPALTACLLAWMTDNKPEALEKARWVLTITDYVRYRLTGLAHAEITTLSGGGTLNVATSAYDMEMLSEMGISGIYDKLPPVVQSTDICGRVTAQAAWETGLLEGTPVAGGMYDIDSAGIAAGMVDETIWNVIAGTWCNNQYISQKPLKNKNFFSTTVYAKPGYWLMLEGSPTSASNLEWFVREFLQTEKQQAKAAGTSVYDICNDAVRCTEADETDIVFVPFLYGSNAGRKAKAVFVGLEGWHKRAHVIRAIYEGICFSHRYHIEKILAVQTPPQAVRIAGGAARSDVWVQMFADVLRMPMELTAATELGTMGAAMCAGVGAGLFGSFDEAVKRMVHVTGRAEPDKAAANMYARKYDMYKKAIESLGSYWE